MKNIGLVVNDTHSLVAKKVVGKKNFEGVLAKRIEELLRECANVNRWNIEELNIQPDHVHFRPDIAVSKVE